MPAKKKHLPAPAAPPVKKRQNFKPGSPDYQAQLFFDLKRKVREMVMEGHYDGDPRLAERLKDYNPVLELAVIANDPHNHIGVRLLAQKEVAEHVSPKMKAVEIKGQVDTRIIVEVAQFAAAELETQYRQQIEGPVVEDAEVIDDGGQSPE